MKAAFALGLLFFSNSPATAQSDAFSEPKVHVVTQEWVAGGYGVVNVANITVRNNNPFAIKDIQITCSFFGASGTKISAETKTIFQILPPKTTRTFRGINLGYRKDQGEQGSCKVISSDLK